MNWSAVMLASVLLPAKFHRGVTGDLAGGDGEKWGRRRKVGGISSPFFFIILFTSLVLVLVYFLDLYEYYVFVLICLIMI